MPRVSVIIPVYNREDLVGETIDSVLSQTYRDHEIIVVDDGSTDGTVAALDKYDGRIRIIQQDNQGEGLARNAGIEASSGEFVAFVDSDDLWHPEKLRLQMELLDASSHLHWAYSDAEVFDHKTRRRQYYFSQKFPLHSGEVSRQLFLQCFIPSPTPIIRRSVIESVGGFWDGAEIQTSRGVDWDTWLRISDGYPLGLVNRPLARYRVHSGTLTSSQNQNWQTTYAAGIAVIERAAARNPSLQELQDQAMAQLTLGTGRTLARLGDRTTARILFGRSIRHNPLRAEAYFNWLSTFLSQPLLDRLIQAKHWATRKHSRWR